MMPGITIKNVGIEAKVQKKNVKKLKHDASFCLIEHLTAAFELLENVCSNTTIQFGEQSSLPRANNQHFYRNESQRENEERIRK